MKTIKKSALTFIFLATIPLLAAGCNSSDQQKQTQPPKEISQTNNQVAGDVTMLPTKNITVSNTTIVVEVADTDASRTLGLSHREKLNDGTGMLFDFTNTSFTKPGFWMKDMRISIDIIWIYDNTIIGIEKNVPFPPDNTNLPIYYPPSAVTHALEVPAGWTEKNNITVGETVTL